ncbi:ATP-binding cassette domain-containing protein [Bacteroides caccae]|jgi:putative ABC transport system ATP-binding protein|uniref:ATP-binding cassette domain-containing protein n=1 Tax=Bacteroides caccae TaxID=47678 RepID=A0A6L3KYF6_9BACE|nr:ATP-binding cassette domain-containing protein [Bacteroides caccae]KAA5446945.1 ATP-binding cassette domain-containing protein [Bacteroides caccae]KAA5466581.1 ATP-binding cassette domain-containing protein [Bacteroides caccae]
MLHINNACIAFGTEVLFSGFEMKLEKGETACIVGQSGCGKTSLLNAVMGFVPLYEGTIKVGGTLLDKSTIDLVRRQIAWIPQELALPFEWVKEMVSLPFELKVNRSVPFSEERLFMCFDELGLEHELYFKRVNEVSGGQRQRIMLAVAALLNKPLIVIDEPTSALDTGSTDKVLAFFRRQAKKGAAVLAVSHDKDFASGCHYLIEL